MKQNKKTTTNKQVPFLGPAERDDLGTPQREENFFILLLKGCTYRCNMFGGSCEMQYICIE